jgi:hypothetical protein
MLKDWKERSFSLLALAWALALAWLFDLRHAVPRLLPGLLLVIGWLILAVPALWIAFSHLLSGTKPTVGRSCEHCGHHHVCRA